MRALGHLEACLGDAVLDAHLQDLPGTAVDLEAASAALPAALAETQQAGRCTAPLLMLGEYIRTAQRECVLERWARVRSMAELAHGVTCQLIDEEARL